MSVNLKINPEDHVVYSSKLKKYVITINNKNYYYEQLKKVDFFNKNPQYQVVEKYYLKKIEERPEAVVQSHNIVEQSHKMLLNLTKVTNATIKEGNLSNDTLKDDAAIKILGEQIQYLKNQYQQEDLSENISKAIDSMINIAKIFIDPIYNNMEDNVTAFIANMQSLYLTGMRKPIYYKNLIENIRVPGNLYHGVGNQGYWTSVYLRKPVYNEALNNGFEGLWYAVYKGAVTIGGISRKRAVASNSNSDDYKKPIRTPISNSTQERSKKETKPHETENLEINNGSANIKVNSEINEAILKQKETSNYGELSEAIDKEINSNDRRKISIVMQCTIVTPFKSTTGNALLEIDLKNPGIYSTTADMLSGAKTYAFRGAAALLFKKLGGIKWSSATGTSGLGHKTAEDFYEIMNEKSLNRVDFGVIENSLFISSDQIKFLNQLQGAPQMNNSNRTITEGNETRVVTNMTNTTNEENVNIQTINNTNTYQEINVPVQPGTEMEEVEENQEEKIEQ